MGGLQTLASFAVEFISSVARVMFIETKQRW